MKIISTLLFSSLFISQLAFAHMGGHGANPISEKEAIRYASDGIELLAADDADTGKKIDASWKNIPDTQKTISKKGDGYYIVNFKNQQNKVLYVLISDQGEIYDANFSGSFEGLEQ